MNRPASQTRFWLLALLVLAFLVWVLKPILLPFIAGFVIAYFLNPAVDSLTRMKMPRWLGALLVLLGFIALLALVSVLVLPLLEGQVAALVAATPEYIQAARDSFVPWVEKWVARLSPGDVENLREAAGQYAGNAVGWIGKVLQGILKEGMALFDILTLLVVTPVVAFYLLKDWPKLTQNTDNLLPRQHQGDIRGLLSQINSALSGFIRGQALVCLVLGVIYSVGLSLAGLKYGATIGIIGGILSFVPYLGSSFVFVSSLILALMQYADFMHVGLVVLVFVIGQSLEGYVLTPKLVGDRIGLHPLWILFALFAGGSLLGFVGVLIAVPVAAIAGVLIRFALRRYKASALYRHKAP